MKILPLVFSSQSCEKYTSFKSARVVDAEAAKDLAKLGDFYSLENLIVKRKSKLNPHPLGTYLKRDEIIRIKENPLYNNVFLTKSEIQESRFYRHNMLGYITNKINSAVSISNEHLKKVLPDIEKVKNDYCKFKKAQENARKELRIEKLFNFNLSKYPMERFNKAS